MKSLRKASIRYILYTYTFPHRFYVRYAYACADAVRHLMADKASTDALDLVAKWLADANAVTKEELRAAADRAYAASYNAFNAYAATYTASARTSASYASYTTSVYNAAYNASAYNAACYAQSAKPKHADWAKDLLLQMINDLSNTEKLIIFGKTL